MDKSIDIRNLKRCAEISRQSRAGGNTPFGALLADKEQSAFGTSTPLAPHS